MSAHILFADNGKQVDCYIKEAEYYQRKADNYRREVQYDLKKAEGYERDAQGIEYSKEIEESNGTILDCSK